MSQIASFYLIKNNQRQELSDGDCSGAVYMAIWDWCESELDLDVRFPGRLSRVNAQKSKNIFYEARMRAISSRKSCSEHR